MTGPFKSARAYRLLTSLLGPLLPLWIRHRARKGKEDPKRLGERLGRIRLQRPEGELIWLHGASVGETQMIRPLIDRLLKKADRHVLVTSGTRTSAELLDKQLPPRTIHQYVPLDTPKATARFIAHWAPDLAVFVESELWPNLIWTTARNETPLALINARMSQKSLMNWRGRPRIARSVLGAFNLILAADDQTARGISGIIRRDVPNIGNLKFDAPALGVSETELSTLKAAIGDRPVWLAASSHEAEEDVFHRLQSAIPEAFMIWLPRHPERGPHIAKTLKAPLRSSGAIPKEGDGAYIMDTMGEMGLALRLADVCVLGGSFHPSLMGHNPLESARLGVPVISGPFHDSFKDLYGEMAEAKAVMISDEADIIKHIRMGLSGQFDDMVGLARIFADSRSGALDTTVEALEALL